MSFEFSAETNPSKELQMEVEAFAPANPFYTSTYIEARRLLGFQPCVFTLRQDGQLRTACTAFMKSGFLNRSLEITSLASIPDSDAFWEGLQQFCRKVRVSYLEVNSFASTSVDIPSLPGEIERRIRWEYVLELQKPGLWDRLSSNHVRNIKRGRRAGLQVRRAVDALACREHARLVEASMNRRESRGESVPEDIHAHRFVAITHSGAGELFQVTLAGKVLSSLLVLLADQGAFYKSAGTSSEGMACGASHFLVHEIANILRARSMELFNLGGTAQLNTGLERFKAGFGATTVKLEAAQFFLGRKARRKFGTTIRSSRDNSVNIL
ncbi:MAG: GNAT family N-acetyltransferase [Woeseia sp.]